VRSGQGQAGSNALSVTTGNPGVQVEDTIQRLETRRQQLQQQIADLQDEARRQGVSPSWVR
jgi:cell division protein FtsB